ncbi:MAG: peptidoglycan D,D-transpeptidase FtsI family protein [Lacrimispora saccharolytica]
MRKETNKNGKSQKQPQKLARDRQTKRQGTPAGKSRSQQAAEREEQTSRKKMTSDGESKNRQKKASAGNPGRPYFIVSYLFIGIFLSLIAYLVYFNVTQKETYLSDSHNTRQKDYAEKVIRGSIISSDNVELARTDVDEEGNETRVYPHAELFAHVVGYLSKGSSGLEATQNYQLLESHADPLERLKNEFKDQKNIGDNVITTINSHMQQVAYDALGDHKGAVIALEPDTGRVLVSVSKPSIRIILMRNGKKSNADKDNSGVFLNRDFRQYPPGSTFKIVTALAYLRQNQTVDGFSFDCEGELTSGNYTLHCAGNSVHGQQDFYEAFANSCNTAFATIGLSLDKGGFQTLADSLYLNSRLELELPTSRSRFSVDSSTAEALMMQTSIGQGNTVVTPMEMALITAAVANDGVMMKPYFVDRVESHDGTLVEEYESERLAEVMSTSEADKLTELMLGVVKDGTARSLNDLDYNIAGKTGSAEHGDMTEDTHSWFVGFSNAEDPDLVVAVIAEAAGSGSSVATPIARQVFEAYYGDR